MLSVRVGVNSFGQMDLLISQTSKLNSQMGKLVWANEIGVSVLLGISVGYLANAVEVYRCGGAVQPHKLLQHDIPYCVDGVVVCVYRHV